MAILSYVSQPEVQSLHAMMRPVVVKALSSETVSIAYCDVYINDTYIGTFSATAYEKKVAGSLQWSFDIRTKIQEYFEVPIPAESNIGEIRPGKSSCRVFVKLRDSSIQDGIVVPEGPVPVMGVGDELPIPGGGLKSNEFFVIRATLQHEDNQNYQEHLANFRKGVWAMDAWPLTHRPNGYQVLPGRPDSFPFATTGNHQFSKIRINYRRINRVIWETAIAEFPTAPLVCNATIVSITITTNSNGSASVAYQLSGAGKLYWSHPNVASGDIQGPEETGSFTIPAMAAGTYTVEFTPRCDNDEYGTPIQRQYVVSARPTTWRARTSDAICLQSGGNNTGNLAYQYLEQVYTDVSPNTLTGQTKPNVVGDPDYVPPVYNITTCPVPPPPNGGREIIGRMDTAEVSICSAPFESFYIALQYLVPQNGITLYYNQQLTVPVDDINLFLSDDGLFDISSTGVLSNKRSFTC